MSARILIAGIGNIFHGDDAFGVEVARQLAQLTWPDEVKVEEFGIRGYDVACACSAGYEAVILVDAAPRGQAPGTVYLMELDRGEAEEPPEADPHGLTPASVLRLARALGAELRRVFLVGCEPAVLEAEDGNFGLSRSVASAVPSAIELIQALVLELTQTDAGEDAREISLSS